MRLLWIGAHPDDELFVVPWLASLKTAAGAACGFLVATRGERGPCYRPEGCRDLAAIREEEMRDAASVLGGEVWFADCRDGSGGSPGEVLRAWSEDAGGEEALEARFRAVITRFAPDRIVTFDANNGCTGHADHRAVGMLVQQLRPEIPVTLAETRLSWSEPLRITPAVEEAEAFDAAPYWDTLLSVLRRHRSQMTPRTIRMFEHVPPAERRLWLRHLS